MIYYDIHQSILDQVLHDGDTAWLTISAAIQESDQGFPDTTFIEVRITFNSPPSPLPTLSHLLPIYVVICVLTGHVAPGHTLRAALVAVQPRELALARRAWYHARSRGLR